MKTIKELKEDLEGLKPIDCSEIVIIRFATKIDALKDVIKLMNEIREKEAVEEIREYWEYLNR